MNNTDRFPANPEVITTVDFGYNWNNGLGAPAFAQYDLFSVLLHEVTHALGIASLATSTGASAITGSTTFTTWDDLLHQTAPNSKVWSAGRSYQLGATGLNSGDNTVRFQGTNTNTVFGSFPAIYTPSTFASGSSVSHWQSNAPTPATSVMRPAIFNGASNRMYQPFEMMALKDLGYAVPVAGVNDWSVY